MTTYFSGSFPRGPRTKFRSSRRGDRWPGGGVGAWVLAFAALSLAGILLAHEVLPDLWGARLLIESALPWCGALIPVLAVAGLVRRTKVGAISALVPAGAWLFVFGSSLLPLGSGSPVLAEQVSVVSQNMLAGNPDPDRTLGSLMARAPDILALQEVTGQFSNEALAKLAGQWPYQVRAGTVMLLSRFPIDSYEPLNLGLGWKRALHANVQTPSGPLSVYVVHAASARPDDHVDRDAMLLKLSDLISNDLYPRILAAGDFNAAVNDASLSGLEQELSEARQSSGGFGFSWPASFPLTRPDHIFVRGLQATRMEVLENAGSDHRGIYAGFSQD